jgi:hypothetical protein
MFGFGNKESVVRGIDAEKSGEDSIEGYVSSIQNRIEQLDEDRGLTSVVAMGLQGLESDEVTAEQLAELSSEQLARRIDYTRMAESVFSDPASSLEDFSKLQSRFESAYTLIDNNREQFLSSKNVSYKEFVGTIQAEHLLEESLEVIWDSLKKTLSETMAQTNECIDLDKEVLVRTDERTSLRMMMEGLSSLSGGADTWLTDKLDELERDGFVKFELN